MCEAVVARGSLLALFLNQFIQTMRSWTWMILVGRVPSRIFCDCVKSGLVLLPGIQRRGSCLGLAHIHPHNGGLWGGGGSGWPL